MGRTFFYKSWVETIVFVPVILNETCLTFISEYKYRQTDWWEMYACERDYIHLCCTVSHQMKSTLRWTIFCIMINHGFRTSNFRFCNHNFAFRFWFKCLIWWNGFNPGGIGRVEGRIYCHLKVQLITIAIYRRQQVSVERVLK